MAKLPKFGDPDGNTTGESFTLPKFEMRKPKPIKVPAPKAPQVAPPTAPRVSAPTAPQGSFSSSPSPMDLASRIAQARMAAPTQPVDKLTELQQGDVLGDIGRGLSEAAQAPALKPIISAATALFGTIETGLNWWNGFQFAQAKENNEGIITSDDIRDAAFQGRKINGEDVRITGYENGQPVYNIQPNVTDRQEIEAINARRRQFASQNATSWTRGEPTVYGGDVMREWGLDDTPGALGISEAGRTGFLRDLVMDPINAVPFTPIFRAIGAVGKGASGAYDAMKLANRGELSANVAKTLGFSDLGAGRIVNPPAQISPKFRGIGGAAAERVQKSQKFLDEKAAYKTAIVSPTNNPLVENLAVLGSGLEAGLKATIGAFVKSGMDDFLRKYAGRDVTFRGKVVTQVVQKADNDYRVLSGNGEELGRAKTRFEAKELAARIRQGESAAGLSIRTADDVTRALESVEKEFTVPAEAQNAATAKLPEEAAEPATIEPFTPYESKDGKWWVYDGTKIYKTPNRDDAERVIDALLWTEQKLEEAVVTKTGKTYQVRAGEQIFSAKTKAEADSIAKAYNEGTLPQAVISARGKAVTDTQPGQIALADVLKVPATTEEGKTLKAILSKLDKISAKAVGTRAVYKGQVKDRIMDIIRNGEQVATQNKILAKVDNGVVQEIRDAIAGKESNPFALYDVVLNGNPLRPIVGDLTISLEGQAPVKLSSLAARYKEWKPKVPPAEVKIAIESELAGLEKRIAAIKASGVENVGPQQKYDLIKAEFGEQVADRIKETGILETFTKADKEKASAAVKSFYAVIDSLLEQATEVRFTGIEDLIRQVKNNSVVVDETSLKQIFKLIDPNNNIIAKAEDATVKDASIYTYNELFKSEGVRTIHDIQVQLTHLGDFDNLLKLSGISDDLLLAQLIKDIRNPEGGKVTEFVTEAVAKESKQAIAQRVANADPALQTRVLEAIAEANAETFARLQDDILPNPEAQIETLDTFGKVVSRSTELQYAEGSKAIQNRVFNQVRERKLFNVLSGINRAALNRRKGGLNRQQLMDDTIEGLKLASDNLGLLDIRITSVKFRNDEDYIRAFEKAKKEKKPFDITKDGNFAYLHMGDIMQVFKDTGANDLLLESFFPPNLTSGKPPKNYLSIQGFSDAARQALEMKSKGKAVDVDQLTARILDSGLDVSRYSASFQKRYKDLARELAEHLAREDVLEGLSAAHLEKSLGVASRWINSAETIGRDLERLLYEAWEANWSRGDLSDTARVELIRSHMRKVLYITDVFRIEGGPIAESAIKAVSNMMLKRGLINTPDSADEVTKLLGQEEAAAFRKVINTLYLYEKPQFALKPGQTKFVNARESGKIQNRLVEAEANYETVMRRVDEQYSSDPKVRQQFYRDRSAVQAKLDRARLAAVEAGISTRHYSPTRGWIPSEKFNYEAEARRAQQRLLNYEAAKSGLKAREDFIADSRPVMPKATILTGKRRDEFLAKQAQQLAVVHVENAASRIRNANIEVEKLLDNAHYENLGATPEEAAEMYFQHTVARGQVENTEIKVEFPGDHAVMEGATVYGAVGKQLENIVTGRPIGERLYGLSQARRDVAPIMRRAETMYHKITDRYANLLRGMAVALRNTPPQVIEDAFDLIKRGEVLDASASEDLIRAYGWLAKAWEPLIQSMESAITTQRGINGNMLATAFEKVGLGEGTGMPSPRNLTPEELPNFYRNLPFGKFELPADVPPDSTKASVLRREFEESKELLRQKQPSPITTMLRMMQATQNIVYQKGLAEDFVARFSYKAEGLTYAQAKQKGYVELKEVFGGESLIKYLPDPKNGGLFPPELGRQFFSMMREYNQMFESASAKAMQDWKYEGMMNVVGAFKASQTILVPRHHVTNFLGDMSTAMIRNVVNPAYWGDAARMATSFALRRAGAEYFTGARIRLNPNQMEVLFKDMFRSFAGRGRVLKGVEDAPGTNGIVIYEGGKPVRKNLSDDDFINLLEDWGIIEESIYQQDIQGLVDYLDANGLGGQDLSIARKINKGFRSAMRTITKAPGDFAAGYGNIPRIAHAKKLLQERSWGSIEQAMDAVANEIALFHPTAKSLAAGERQWGRFVTTYYTWMRMAQVGMLRMIGENTRQVIGIQKTIFEWNREQMGEDNRPINIGVGYGGDVNKMPSYLTSTSGVTRITGQNLQGILQTTGLSNVIGNVPESMLDKELQLFFPLMYNDAINYWKADYDPYRSVEAEIWSGTLGPAASGMNPGILPVFGKNISLIGEPIVSLLYGINPATGQKQEVKSFADFTNLMIGSNLGLAKPLEAWLNPNLTEEEKFVGKFRSLIGLGLLDPQTEGNKRNAENQFNKRTKDFFPEILKQEGAPEPGSMLSERLIKVIRDKAREQEEQNK